MSKGLKHLVNVTVITLVLTVISFMAISGNWFLFEVVGIDTSNWTGLVQPPIAASEEAVIIDRFFSGHFWVIASLFSLVFGMMIYAVFAFRRQPGDDEDGEYIHGNTALEIAWTALPLVLVVAFGIWGVNAYTEVVAAEPNETTIHVEGYKWDWAFFYPQYENHFDENLYVPVNQPVVLKMKSRDVMHAFWVPEFRVKQDVYPQLYTGDLQEEESWDTGITEIRFTPIEVGEYQVRCAELCGTQHWSMYATVYVLPQAEYDEWAASLSE